MVAATDDNSVQDNVKAKIQDKEGIHCGGAQRPSSYGFWEPAAVAALAQQTTVSIETKVTQLMEDLKTLQQSGQYGMEMKMMKKMNACIEATS